MFKSDFSELRALRVPFLETQQGSGTVGTAINTILSLMDKNGKKDKASIGKMEGSKIQHTFDPNEDKAWMKAIAVVRDLYAGIVKNQNTRLSVDTARLHADMTSLDEIHRAAEVYIINPAKNFNAKGRLNILIEEHDNLVQKLFDLNKKDPTKKMRTIRELEMKLSKIKADAVTILNFIIEVYKLAGKYFSSNSYIKPQIKETERFLPEKIPNSIKSMQVDAELVKKRFNMSGVTGVLTKLPGSDEKEHYVAHIDYITPSGMLANASGEIWLVELMNLQDTIMAKLEWGCRVPAGRWVFEQILSKDELRDLDTKVALTKIHEYFHEYAWAIAMNYYITYGPSPYASGLMHGYSNIEDVIDVVLNDYIKTSIIGAKMQIDAADLSNRILYAAPVNSNGKGIHQHMLPNVYDVATYLIENVDGYDGLDYDSALTKFYKQNVQLLVDNCGGNQSALSVLPFEVKSGEDGVLYVDFNSPHTMDEFTKALTDDYTLSWATVNNHTRIGSALDEYICTQIINPAKNP